MSDPHWQVVETHDLVIEGPELLKSRALLSPFVWRDGDGYCLLLRTIAQDDVVSGRIWFGRGDDGITFRMDETPLIVPSLAELDVNGCEDPTVEVRNDETYVFYTGVDGEERGELLYASGSGIRSLAKRGIAFSSSRTELNTKEATIVHDGDGRWRLFHEYAQDDRSCIGLAIGGSPAGPWGEHSDPIVRRPGGWDGYHLSTGPLLDEGGDELLMFYNGSDEEPRWSIGWATFDRATLTLRDRCAAPLIEPPKDDHDACQIVFAASLIRQADGTIDLYYSRDDRMPRRATLRRR